MRRSIPIATILALLALPPGWAAETAAPSIPIAEQKADLSGLLRYVPPLQGRFPKGWQPTLFWWQAPLSYDSPRQLKQELEALSARGLLPCVELEAEYEVARALVDQRIREGKAIAAAGFPVHLAMKGALDLYKLPGGKIVRHADAPDVGGKDAVGQEFPCLLLREGWKARAEHVGGLMRKFKQAGVPVAGVWYDYEGHPHVWNGMMGHVAKCPGCQRQFKEIRELQRGPESLPPLSDGFDLWVAWAGNYHAQALAEAFARPVREAYPGARIGFYGFTVTGAACATGGSEVNPAEIDVAQPVCYAQAESTARAHFGKPEGGTQGEMDEAYFLGLLGAMTGVVRNLRANQMLMPFVCRVCGESATALEMNQEKYREFLRHAILRGARGFYVFNVAPPYGPMANYYTELVDVNAVYNEMFAYREFLEGGETLNQDWITPLTPTTARGDWRQPGRQGTWSRGAIVDGLRVWLPTPTVRGATVWSGLRKGARALVRVVTLGEKATFAEVTPFPGVTVRLLATPAGNSYIVDKAGKVEAVQ